MYRNKQIHDIFLDINVNDEPILLFSVFTFKFRLGRYL